MGWSVTGQNSAVTFAGHSGNIPAMKMNLLASTFGLFIAAMTCCAQSSSNAPVPAPAPASANEVGVITTSEGVMVVEF